MNVVFSSDDNYAQHLGVAIYSLLNNTDDSVSVHVFIIENSISQLNKQRLHSVVVGFRNAQLAWIDFAEWKDSLHLNMEWNISLSSYARLFLCSMLPDNVDKVLYLDCDVLITGSLDNLWDTDITDYPLAAVQDNVSRATKDSIGLSNSEPYFNAGVLLVNVALWRKQKVEQQFLSFINKYGGKVGHHDQGVLNGVFAGRWKHLDMKYNVMTLFFLLQYQKALAFYEEGSVFYSEKDVKEAITHPAIVHFTPSLTSRPWNCNCVHPMRNEYWKCLAMTPWQGANPEKDTSKWYVKLLNWQKRTF